MTTVSIIYTVFPDIKSAQKIISGLLQRKLIACANVHERILSMYLWKGEVVNDTECAAILKIAPQHYKEIEKYILDNHPYECPAILELAINNVNSSYANWIQDMISE